MGNLLNKDIIEMECANGTSISDMAKKYNVSYYSMKKILSKYNLKINEDKHKEQIRNKSKMSSGLLWKSNEYKAKMHDIFTSEEYKNKLAAACSSEEYKNKRTSMRNSEEYRN